MQLHARIIILLTESKMRLRQRVARRTLHNVISETSPFVLSAVWGVVLRFSVIHEGEDRGIGVSLQRAEVKTIIVLLLQTVLCDIALFPWSNNAMLSLGDWGCFPRICSEWFSLRQTPHDTLCTWPLLRHPVLSCFLDNSRERHAFTVGFNSQRIDFGE